MCFIERLGEVILSQLVRHFSIHTCALRHSTCFTTRRCGSALEWIHHYLHRPVSRGNSKPIRKAEGRGLEFSLETDSADTISTCFKTNLYGYIIICTVPFLVEIPNPSAKRKAGVWKFHLKRTVQTLIVP